MTERVMAREAPSLNVSNDTDDGDEALRQIENELAVVEEAMSVRQRCLDEVDQQLAMAGCGVSLRPSLDPVVEAASEDAGTTPLLRNCRSVTDTSAVSPEACKTSNGELAVNDCADVSIDATTLPDLSPEKIGEEKALSPPSTTATAKSSEGQSLSTKQDHNGKDPLEQGLSPGQRLVIAPAVATARSCLSDSFGSRGRARREGAATAPVSRMNSMPTRADNVFPPRPYEAMGSLRCGSPRTTSVEPQTRVVPMATVVTVAAPHGFTNGGASLANIFGYPSPASATASISPRRVTSMRPSQMEMHCSADNLKGAFTPRGSSLPPEARRMFSGQAPPVAAGTPSASSPRSSFGNASVTGSFTPRLPHSAAISTRAAGYPGVISNVSLPNGVPSSVDVTPRRSPSSPMSPRQPTGTTVATVSGGLGSATAFTQYGSRFSAVAPTGPPTPVTVSSRTATPQPACAGGRSSASTSAAAAVVEAMGATLLAAGSRFVPVAVPSYAAEVRSRDSSVSSAAPILQQRAPSIVRAGSPVAVLPDQSRHRLWYESGNSPQDMRGISPATPRLQVSSQLSSHPAQQGPALRNGLVTAVPTQPSRYAYVNSNTRRDCAPNPREARRRGRV